MNKNSALPLSRRDMLKFAGAGMLGVPMSGWLNTLATHAAQTGQTRHKHVILLFMNGGPSQKDTFDLKPGTANASPARAINTNVNGIQISEYFPRLAQVMNHCTIVRSMTTPEGDHGRGQYYMHTGFREGSGGLAYPSLGAICSSELGRPDFNLPNFVSIGGRAYGAGFLGPRHQPLVVGNPNAGVENLRPFVATNQFNDRVGLLDELEQGFLRNNPAAAQAEAHRTTYQRAVTLLRSREARAFDLTQEPAAARTAYGTGQFATGCLLARRLVETGVSFVEVGLGGWDTHQNNNARVATLAGQVDRPFAQLITDLRDRGLLNDTLIVWMGEFGRTPRINANGGRDHFPRAWSAVLAGAGMPNGRVVGSTDREGAAIANRPVTGLQFLASICRAVGIDHNKQNQTPIGRPVRIVDWPGEPVREIFS